MQFVGPPYTFAINLINEGIGLVGPKACATAPNGTYWMSNNNFYVYNGSVNTLRCKVQNYVFGNINLDQAYKFHAFTINDKTEVGWFYCSSGSSNIDRYVLYNYAEDAWSYGELARTAWLDTGVEPYPRAVENGYLYEQETGFDADGLPMENVYIQSSDFDIGEGDNFQFINRLIPDFKFLQNPNNGSVNIALQTRDYPGNSLTVASTSSIQENTGQVNVRARGRQAALRFGSDDDATNDGNLGIGWRLGATRIDIRQDGRR